MIYGHTNRTILSNVRGKYKARRANVTIEMQESQKSVLSQDWKRLIRMLCGLTIQYRITHLRVIESGIVPCLQDDRLAIVGSN
jgi:hypothetical protein